MAAPTNITEIGAGIHKYSAQLFPRTESLSILTRRNGKTYAVGYSSNLYDSDANISPTVLSSSDHGQSWTKLDESNKPSHNPGRLRSVALSYDGSKIAMVMSKKRADPDFYNIDVAINVFDMDAAGGVGAWESGHGVVATAPIFVIGPFLASGVNDAPQNTSQALIGRSDGTWLFLYHRFEDRYYSLEQQLVFSIYNPSSHAWTTVDAFIVNRAKWGRNPADEFDYTTYGVFHNFTMTALADDGLDHVWYDETSWNWGNVYTLKHRTISGTAVSGADDAYSCDNAVPSGTLPNTNNPFPFLLSPIRWASKGKIILPIGLSSKDAQDNPPSPTEIASNNFHTYGGFLMAATGAGTPFSFTHLGSSFSIQLAACERIDGSLAVVYKNYLRSSTDPLVIFLATLATSTATPVISQYFNIDPPTGGAYNFQSPHNISGAPFNVFARHMYIVADTYYEDRIAMVLDITRETFGRPFPLHSLWGDEVPLPDCCCINAPTAY